MNNLFSFMFGAAIGAGALTLCALFDDEKVKDKLSNLTKKDFVSDEELDEIIQDTEKEIENTEKIQKRIDECASKQDSIAEDDPNAMEKHLSILDKQNNIFEELRSN